MWAGMISALCGEFDRQAALADMDDARMHARIAGGMDKAEARSEMLSERTLRYERDRKLADEMRKLMQSDDSSGIDPLYLGAAFALGMEIG